MATFKITTANSVVTTATADNAFDGDTAGADKLIVDPDGSLVASIVSIFGPRGSGALLANTGAWTVTVNGSIFAESSTGIDLAAGNAGVSKITIGQDGKVEGTDAIIARECRDHHKCRRDHGG